MEIGVEKSCEFDCYRLAIGMDYYCLLLEISFVLLQVTLIKYYKILIKFWVELPHVKWNSTVSSVDWTDLSQFTTFQF